MKPKPVQCYEMVADTQRQRDGWDDLRRCKLPAVKGHDFCHLHISENCLCGMGLNQDCLGKG